MKVISFKKKVWVKIQKKNYIEISVLSYDKLWFGYIAGFAIGRKT